MTDYPHAIWTTQKGGVVRQDGERYVFVETPLDFPEIKIGDQMPSDWELTPANVLARPDLEDLFLD